MAVSAAALAEGPAAGAGAEAAGGAAATGGAARAGTSAPRAKPKSSAKKSAPNPRTPAVLGGPQSPPRRSQRLRIPALDKGQKTLFVTWAAVVGLAVMQDVIVKKDWPCPGRYVKISALYLMLGFLGEFNSSLASMLGVGFAIAFLTRSASKEVVQSGTFFGIKVK